MTSFADLEATLTVQLAALAPQLAGGTNSQTYRMMIAGLSAIYELYLSEASFQQGYTVPTAVGGQLDLLGSNVGVTRGGNTPAAGYIQFSVPSVVTITADEVVIPVGATVSTPSPNPVTFITLAPGIIPVGSSVSNLVAVEATTLGIAGNVAANTITIPTSGIPVGVSATNPYAIDGTNSTTLGVNAQSDGAYAAAILAGTRRTKPGDLLRQIILANGAYDAYISDPKTGTVTYYWCLVDGSAPGVTAAGAVAAGTLGATIDTAVQQVIENGIAAVVGYSATNQSLTVVNLTAIPIIFSAPPTVSYSVISPLIQAAVVAYVQSLRIGQPVLASSLISTLMQTPGLAGVITNVSLGTSYGTLGSTTPASSSPTPTTIYRANSGTVVSVVQV